MKTLFNKKKFKSEVLSLYETFEKYAETLKNRFNFERQRSSVTKWGDEKYSNLPTAGDLPIVADSLGLNICELYTNYDQTRLKILDQILKDPTQQERQRLGSFSTLSGGIVSSSNEGNAIYLARRIRSDHMLEAIAVSLLEDTILKQEIYAKIQSSK